MNSPSRPPSPLDALREENTGSRSQRVCEKIKEMILSGKLPPGYVFPNENDMCAQLSIGRSTLREAYRTLTDLGLIRRAKTGTCVNDLQTIMDKAPFSVAAELSSLKDIIEFRFMLEGEIARYAALRATAEETAALGRIIEASRGALGRYPQLQDLDLKFHFQLADASHNYLLCNTLSTAWSYFEDAVVKNYSRLKAKAPAALDEAVEQHAEVYEAIRRQDEGAAKAAMREHLSFVYGDH